MFKTVGMILLCIFVGVGLFAFSEAFVQLKANRSLSWQIENTLKPKLVQLEKDTAQLKEDKSQLTEDLVETKSALGTLEQENDVLTKTLNEKNTELQALNKANQEKEQELVRVSQQQTELKGENALLKDKITAMFLELKEMHETVSSVEKLKERIRFLKGGVKKKNKLAYAPQRTRPKKEKKQQDVEASSGNGGFLTRDGRSTYQTVTIRVSPVEE